MAGGSKRDACKSEACAIQDCLAKNDYNISKCQDKVDKLKNCCKDNLKESVHCGMLDSSTDTDSGASQKPDDQVHNTIPLCTNVALVVQCMTYQGSADSVCTLFKATLTLLACRNTSAHEHAIINTGVLVLQMLLL